MANKETKRIVKINSYNEKQSVYTAFQNALYYGTLKTRNGELFMETDTEVLIMRISDFKENFENAKLNPNIKFIKSDYSSYTVEDIDIMISWLNPVIDELDIQEFNATKQQIEDGMQKLDESNPNYDKKGLENFKEKLERFFVTNNIDDEKKHEYINRLMKFNCVTKDDLIYWAYYVTFSESYLYDKYKKGDLLEEEFYEIGEQKNSKNKLIEYAESDKSAGKSRKISASKIRDTVRMIRGKELIDMIFAQQIPFDYLEYSDIKKSEIFDFEYSKLISCLDEMDQFPKRLKISSEDIMNQYGKKISGNKLYNLAMYGYVDLRSMMSVLRINNILRMTDTPEEMLLSDEKVIAFYTDEVLAKMFLNIDENGNRNIDSEFMNEYKEKLNDDKKFDRKSEKTMKRIEAGIIQDKAIPLEEKRESVQNAYIEAYDMGLCSDDAFKSALERKSEYPDEEENYEKVIVDDSKKDEISAKETKVDERKVFELDYLENQFLEEKINFDFILSLYQKGIIKAEVLEKYISEDEIFDLYLDKQVSYEVVSLIKSDEKRNRKVVEGIKEGKILTQDVMKMYFKDIVNYETFVESLEKYTYENKEPFEFNLYMNSEETEFEKIKELFSNDNIDYSMIKELHRNGTITDKQLKELEDTKSLKTFLNSLPNIAVLSGNVPKKKNIENDKIPEVEQITEISEEDLIPEKTKKGTEKFDREKELIALILEVEGKLEPRTHLTYENRKEKTTLDGYNVYASDTNGLVVFEKSANENAVYIMPFYQAAYFLPKVEEKKGQKVAYFEDRVKNKQYLKGLDQVKTIRHTKFFGRDLLDSVCELSPELEEKFKDEKGYIEDVEIFIDEMKEIYEKEHEN